MQLFDTHCHIHESGLAVPDSKDPTQARWAKLGNPAPAKLIADAAASDVTRVMLVGCTLQDSQRAIAIAAQYDKAWASIGIHPHEARAHLADSQLLETFAALAANPQVKAVGECGLDYYYENSPRDDQIKILRFQLELARKHDLPMIFHVREAFDDFWPVVDEFKGIRGVIHSFTANTQVLNEALARGFYVGLNGIMTFTSQEAQLTAAKAVPLEKFVLETDAPFLTPAPDRGTICEPKHVRVTAEFLAGLRGESLEKLADATTKNARLLFDV